VELATLPADVTASFAGVGNPHAIERIREGELVLDVGCGAGTDLLLAARRVGPRGRAIGVDMTDEMRRRAAAGAEKCGLVNVDVRDGDATALPVDDQSIDVVISNGVLNLVPDKPRAFAEMARVLKPGGRAQIADIVIGEVLPDTALRDIDLWTG
jgi:ubiquinone/menaquinone biosynthesis C-methylase UbiE